MVSALSKLWTDRCTIAIQEKSEDQETGVTRLGEKVLYQDIPCRISFSSAPVGQMLYGVAEYTQQIKLFLDKSICVPEGARITVNRTGETYSRCSLPSVYASHQEIELELLERILEDGNMGRL